MDTKLIEYIIKIADEGSITKAAEKLFITQSALSQQLQKLEKEVGTPLFVRSKAAWAPTPEGQIYLDNAREMLRIKQKTYTIIADMVNKHNGYLSVGMTPGRGFDMFSYVYPIFHDKYPEFTVEPRELSVKQQQDAVHKGELDIGFVTLTDAQKTADEYIDLFKEEIYLALPADYPLSKEYLQSDDKYPTVPLTALQYEPFVMMYKESTIRKMVDQIFRDAGFAPTVLFETSSNMTILSMIKARLACGLLPYHYVKQKPDGIMFFRLPFRPTWKVCVTYQKNAYLSKAAKDFIDLVTEFWTKE
ncbi:DNA-binding transcriptional regulator, LysR family [Oribacterium sp. KHPX15]|uniref:LysR family transcriptional regulator n=1 Tax=Oribacterium sp. KHPX15 TaxID=1855342 RepID=UPI000899A505|nr:LysR family transcriptional regulator [Oribacterium sp. KHPX15]SDZ80627.1 DNA-binding transcriptional regulator, LysR family [Oribacterium sp. KHPX15]